MTNHTDLARKIETAINQCSAESGSNTPDFILARYLVDCLTAFDHAYQKRESWYGRAGGEQDGPTPLTAGHVDAGQGSSSTEAEAANTCSSDPAPAAPSADDMPERIWYHPVGGCDGLASPWEDAFRRRIALPITEYIRADLAESWREQAIAAALAPDSPAIKAAHAHGAAALKLRLLSASEKNLCKAKVVAGGLGIMAPPYIDQMQKFIRELIRLVEEEATDARD